MRKFYRVEDEADGSVILIRVDSGWLDGYHVGDTLLEDVKFKITVNEDDTLKAEVHPLSAEYFSKFNEKKWLKAIVDYAEVRDIFDSDPDSEDEYEIIIYDHDKPFDEQQAYFEFEPVFKD